MEQLLTMLKVDLGITTTAYDTRLTQYINSAKEMIGTEGVTLDTTDLEDAQLVVMYAGWLWRKRDNGDAMPRMLRWTLNNRLFAEKMNAEG
jgi:hypothetical protein